MPPRASPGAGACRFCLAVFAAVAVAASGQPHPAKDAASQAQTPFQPDWALPGDVREGGHRNREPPEDLVRMSWPDDASEQAARILGTLEMGSLDVWRRNGTSMDVRLDREQMASLSQYPVFALSTLIPSVTAQAELHRLDALGSRLPSAVAPSRLHLRNDISASRIHDQFHDLANLETILRSFALAFPAATLVSVGTSAEGREILGLHISISPRLKQTFVVAGGQHAREWIAPSTVLYQMHAFLLATTSSARSHRVIRRVLEAFDFTFIPVANPDGYAYTWEYDRLWRKSRQPTADPDCFGLDLNRNWGFHFSPPYRPNPCTDYFPGMQAFSAPETAALAAYLSDPYLAVVAFLDLHAYGEQIMFPYSYSCERLPRDAEDLWEAAYGAAKAVKIVHGKEYEVGQRCDISYTASGDSIDWTYGVADIKWSFSAELRDHGIFGFLMPPWAIRPQGEEALGMLVSIAQFIAAKEGR